MGLRAAAVIGGLWVLALVFAFLFPLTFPTALRASGVSSSLVERRGGFKVLELVIRAIPLFSRATYGVPAVGRTRTFCQVSLHVTPFKLELSTAKTSCVLVTEVRETAVPLATSLMLLAAPPPPPSRVMSTVGAIPPVSKTKPAGALTMMVPVPTLPLAFSE